MASEDEIPRELKEKLATFDTHLSELEIGLQPLLSMNRAELTEKLEPIDVAKTDLVAAYAINSLFWVYLNTCGVNPKDHAVKQELARIQSYMSRVKEVEDKKKAPKLDKGVTKRFVRSALWHAAQNKPEGTEDSEMSTSEHHRGRDKAKGQNRKRRREDR